MSNSYCYIKAKPTSTFPYPLLHKIAICLLIFIIPVYFLTTEFTQTTQAYVSPVSSQIASLEISNKSNNSLSPTNIPIIPTVVLENIIHQVTPIPIATVTPTTIPTVSPTIDISKKKIYSIAVFGDSMVDTMGDTLDILHSALKNKYPEIEFKLYNYGIGSQNVSQGLDRLCQTYNYKNRHYPSLCDLKPDIIILGSFSYNPFYPYDRNKHWLILSKLIEEAQRVSPRVYILAETAPLRNDFGKGNNGVNWDTSTASVHADHIIQQLENTLGLSQTLHVPLIDAFSITQSNNNTKEGSKKYINPNDGIHPSTLGHKLMANLIALTIKIE